MSGYVYFIRGADRIKIGYSENPEARLRSLQTGSPVPLELVSTTPGTTAKEHELHRRFAHLRTHGEWFVADGELEAYAARPGVVELIEPVCLPEICISRIERMEPQWTQPGTRGRTVIGEPPRETAYHLVLAHSDDDRRALLGLAIARTLRSHRLGQGSDCLAIYCKALASLGVKGRDFWHGNARELYPSPFIEELPPGDGAAIVAELSRRLVNEWIIEVGSDWLWREIDLVLRFERESWLAA